MIQEPLNTDYLVASADYAAVMNNTVLPWLKARLAAWVEGRAYDPSQLEAAIGVRATATDDLCAFAPEPVTQGRATAATAIRAARDLALLALFAASCVQVVSGAFNPFIYFQF